mgnify:CR=1 FL=1
MIINIQIYNSSVLAYLENSAEYFPEKCAVTDEKVSYSYSELVKLSSSVGTALSELIVSGDAVGIYMEKCADAVAAFFATVYAGGFSQHGASAEQTSDHSFRTQSKGDCNF